MWGRFLTFLVTRVLARLFPKRYRLIPRRSDGTPLLRQFKITEWCYLQSFVGPEEPDLFHIHRWQKMYSIVLSGEFQEERFPGMTRLWFNQDTPIYTGPHCGLCFLKTHRAPSVYSMDSSDIHRLHYAAANTWTMFFMFGNRKDWGYYPRPTDPEYIPWDIAIPEERKVPPL